MSDDDIDFPKPYVRRISPPWEDEPDADLGPWVVSVVTPTGAAHVFHQTWASALNFANWFAEGSRQE